MRTKVEKKSKNQNPESFRKQMAQANVNAYPLMISDTKKPVYGCITMAMQLINESGRTASSIGNVFKIKEASTHA